MSKTNGSNITLSLRKVSTGYLVVSMQMGDLNHTYSVARILVRSPEYSKCYAVATSPFDDTPLFTVQPESVRAPPAPYQAPQFAPPPQYPQQYPQPYYQQPQAPQHYALPAYQQQPVYPQQGYPQPQPPVIDAEIVSEYGPPPVGLLPYGGRR